MYDVYYTVGTAMLLGFAFSILVGLGAKESNGWGFLFISLFVAIFLAIVVMFAGWLLHYFCMSLKVCRNTSDQTVWTFAYPLIFGTPIYWLTMSTSRAIAK